MAAGDRDRNPPGRPAAPPRSRTGPPGPPGKKPPLLDGPTWFVLFVFGWLLFAAGVYLALGLQHLLGLSNSVPRSGPLVYLPYVLTIVGGALGMYAYEEWYQSEEHQRGRSREPKVRELPSYEHYVPPRDGSPP